MSVVARDQLSWHVRMLLDGLRHPHTVRDWTPAHWDVLARTARNARLLAVLASRVQRAFGDDGLDVLAAPIRDALVGALAESAYLTQMQRVELARVTRVLAPLGIDLVLLKGAAYVAQNAPIATGRVPNDVDVLVAPADLTRAEAALLAAGWQYEDTLDDYDQRYYRAWSHELPPLRFEGFVLELDLHHAILPPTTRVSPPTAQLLARRQPVAGTPWFALAPEDQLLHIAAHVFIDSDCTSRLRDVIDFDALFAHHVAAQPAFAELLIARARELRLLPALVPMLAFTRAWVSADTAHDAAAARALAACQRDARPSPLLLTLASRTLPPHHPDSVPGASERWATRLLGLRYAWWRMPLPLLAYHTVMKSWRGLRGRWSSPGDGTRTAADAAVP